MPKKNKKYFLELSDVFDDGLKSSKYSQEEKDAFLEKLSSVGIEVHVRVGKDDVCDEITGWYVHDSFFAKTNFNMRYGAVLLAKDRNPGVKLRAVYPAATATTKTTKKYVQEMALLTKSEFVNFVYLWKTGDCYRGGRCGGFLVFGFWFLCVYDLKRSVRFDPTCVCVYNRATERLVIAQKYMNRAGKNMKGKTVAELCSSDAETAHGCPVNVTKATRALSRRRITKRTMSEDDDCEEDVEKRERVAEVVERTIETLTQCFEHLSKAPDPIRTGDNRAGAISVLKECVKSLSKVKGPAAAATRGDDDGWSEGVPSEVYADADEDEIEDVEHESEDEDEDVEESEDEDEIEDVEENVSGEVALRFGGEVGEVGGFVKGRGKGLMGPAIVAPRSSEPLPTFEPSPSMLGLVDVPPVFIQDTAMSPISLDMEMEY